MSDGILIGKFSESSRNKVPTFFLNGNKYYYGKNEASSYAFKIHTSKTPNAGSGMFHAGPVILAFWREEDE
jgi:hypothetical protein